MHICAQQLISMALIWPSIFFGKFCFFDVFDPTKIRIFRDFDVSSENRLYDMTEFAQINRKDVFVMLNYQALICRKNWDEKIWLRPIFMILFYAELICAQWLGTGVHICARAHMCTVAMVYYLGKYYAFPQVMGHRDWVCGMRGM